MEKASSTLPLMKHVHIFVLFNSFVIRAICRLYMPNENILCVYVWAFSFPIFHTQPIPKINKQRKFCKSKCKRMCVCVFCLCKCISLHVFRRSQSFIGCENFNISYVYMRRLWQKHHRTNVGRRIQHKRECEKRN